MKPWMPPDEIVASYLQAKEPKKQIRVLAELNAVPADEIRRILRERNVKEPKRTKVKTKTAALPAMNHHKPWTRAEIMEAVRLHEAGVRRKDIAEAMGRAEESIPYALAKARKENKKQ